MEQFMWVTAFVSSFACCSAILELTGSHEIEGTWKSSIILPCVYKPSQGFMQNTVIWTLDRDQSPATVFQRDSSGDHIPLSKYRGRVSIPKHRPGDVSLQIEELEIPDKGRYTCEVTWRAQNNNLLTREKTTTVNVVKVAVTKPIIKPGNLGFTVPKGARTSLTCSASGSPPIIYRWFKGEPGGGAVHVSNHAVLMFDSLQMSDMGKYYCEAENRASSQVIQQSEAVQLTVRDHPKSATTVHSSETQGHTTAMSISEDYQGTSLPLYLIILIAVLCMAVVFVPITVIFCRRKTKKDQLTEVEVDRSLNLTRGGICPKVNHECTYEEAKPKAENEYTEEPEKENEYETIGVVQNNDYETLKKATKSEYELGDVP